MFRSRSHHMDQYTDESWKELIDAQFYYESLVILLLHTVSSAPINCISIKLDRILVKLKLDFWRRTGYFGSKI